MATVACLFASTAGVAHAAPGKVLVRYKLFPGGGELLPLVKVTGSFSTTAATLPGKYLFLFWNKNGAPQTDAAVSDTPSAGTTDFVTAWYEKKGGGNTPCDPNCAVATWAFDSTNDHVMKGVTPVGSVLPSGLWTSPSTSVSTMTSSPSVTITSRATISPPFPADTFQMWIAPGLMTSGGAVTASPKIDAEAIGFYKTLPRKPPLPTPCPTPTPDCHY
jgi:hypothetical protein